MTKAETTLFQETKDTVVKLESEVKAYQDGAVKLKEELAEAKKSLESENNSYRYAAEARDRLQTEVDAVHAALDALNIVAKVGTDSYSPKMPIAARLFAWQAGAGEVTV